ncbi:low density lipoprotein receptor adapter protein 1-like [Micropterus salmoides]|nr:low density lipoprotein receptor adapter protein 1-like [Micropterus salmoides]
MEEKLRRPFFSASLSSPSPRSNPTRRRPIKHDSWDVEDGFDDAFSRLAESRSEPISDDAALSPQEVSNENLLSISNNEFE